MSVDQPLTTIASEDSKTPGESIKIDDIAKGLIAKQSLNIQNEAPILGTKENITDIENNGNMNLDAQNLDQFKPSIEEETPTESLAAAAANVAISFESQPVNETSSKCESDVKTNETEIVKNLISGSSIQETLNENSKSSEVVQTIEENEKEQFINSKPLHIDATIVEKSSITPSLPQPSPTSAKPPKSSQTYSVKWIAFNNVSLPIILQNENGPCPLISICNVLLLRQQMTLKKNVSQITCNDLTHVLANTLFNVFVPRWTKNQVELPSRQRDSTLNLERNIDDALAIFEKLKIGLDVNVKFSTCREFEYTRELDIFDLFQIGLYHGWLIDPQQVMFYKHFFNKSYNQLVELTFYKDKETAVQPNTKAMSDAKNEEEEDPSLVGILAENFLESSASQLTYFGLSELHTSVASNELCVLFRNNHFSTLYKHPVNGKLYLLVTDQGYLTHENIIWETLDNIEGDAVFCDANFKQVSSVTEGDGANFENIDKNELINDACQSDYLLAMSLQEMDDEEARNAATAAKSGSSETRRKQQPPMQSEAVSASSTTPRKSQIPSEAQEARGSGSGEAAAERSSKKDKKDKSSCSMM